LGGSEWDFAVVEFEETGEVDEMTLSGLGSEVSVLVSCMFPDESSDLTYPLM